MPCDLAVKLTVSYGRSKEASPPSQLPFALRLALGRARRKTSYKHYFSYETCRDTRPRRLPAFESGTWPRR